MGDATQQNVAMNHVPIPEEGSAVTVDCHYVVVALILVAEGNAHFSIAGHLWRKVCAVTSTTCHTYRGTLAYGASIKGCYSKRSKRSLGWNINMQPPTGQAGVFEMDGILDQEVRCAHSMKAP